MGVGTMAISPTSASRCWKKEDLVAGWEGGWVAREAMALRAARSNVRSLGECYERGKDGEWWVVNIDYGCANN